jgi:transcriptional regulator with XRE-family HTH domain
MFNDKERDEDTLGGRISRAREAAGQSAPKFAKTVGVRSETLVAWESDRSEPRVNKLVTMAGLLNVSPAWLLYGLGEAPSEPGVSAELQVLRGQLDRIRELREQTDLAIRHMEKAIVRIAERETES